MDVNLAPLPFVKGVAGETRRCSGRDGRARWQHIGEMTNLNNKADTVPAIGYFDLLGSWDLTDTLQLRFNINNVMDELPPTYTPSVQANTDPSTYDTLGRRYTVGLTARF